jgi:hypothetical protein
MSAGKQTTGNFEPNVTASSTRLEDYDIASITSEDPKDREILSKEQIDSSKKDLLVVKTYVRMRSDLFETYAVIASFFSSIGITVYYDTVAEEWIPLREEYLDDQGHNLSRTMIEVSKIFACAGILHSILTMAVIVIGLVFMNLFIRMHSTAQFIFHTKVWFFGWGSWDVKVAEIANVNLSISMLCFLIAAICDVYNRVDSIYTHVIGCFSLPLVGYILYFLNVTRKSWNAQYSGAESKVAKALQALENLGCSIKVRGKNPQ